jgi:hypothetical protein
MHGVATGGLHERLLPFLATHGHRLDVPLIIKIIQQEWRVKKGSYMTIIIKATIR